MNGARAAFNAQSNSVPRAAPETCVSLCDVVRYWAKVRPDAVAVTEDERTWSYADLLHRGEQWATAFAALALEPGSRIAFASAPRPDALASLIGASAAGLVWMGLNPRFAVAELRNLIDAADPAAVFIGDEALDPHALLPARSFVIDCRDAGYLADLKPDFVHRAVAADDPAMLVCTSGSTGAPKAALISHIGLVAGARMQVVAFGLDDVSIICNLPINHVGAMADICAMAIVAGGRVHFQRRFDPRAMLNEIERRSVTIWGGVPTMFQTIVESEGFATADLSSVKLVIWGGAAMSPAVIAKLAARKLPLRTAYGLTETSCHVAMTDTGTSEDDLAASVGCPLPGIQCRIVDDTDTPVAAGELGNLQIRAPTNFIGYFRQPEATAASFTEDHWLRTGDIARIDGKGAIVLAGRSRDVFKSGGELIAPREVELALNRCPNVAASAIVAIPDVKFQEIGVAFVVPQRSVAIDVHALRRLLGEQIAYFKIPKQIHVVDCLPLLPIGKVDKASLKQIAIDRSR